MSFIYVYPPQSVSVATPPLQFELDGIDVTVSQDTVTPANNTPLPASLFIIKDGVVYPVSKDTSTPANTVSVPVELSAVSGPINVTAGDLNVQLTDLGANFDATRVGDGSGNYIKVNSNGSTDVNVLGTIPVSGPLTDTELRATPVTVNGTVTANTGLSQPLTDAQLRSSAVAVDGSGVVQPISAASLPLPTGAATESSVSTTNSRIGLLSETAPATDTASSGLNGRLQRVAQRLTSLISLFPISLGRKQFTESLAVVLSDEDYAELVGVTANTADIAFRLPSTIGQKLSSDSLSVIPASDYIPSASAVPSALTVRNATITVGATAVRATTDGANPSVGRRKLVIFNDPDTSTGKIYIGNSSVTTSGANKGIQIFPGVPTIFENDPNDYFLISDTALNPVAILEVEP